MKMLYEGKCKKTYWLRPPLRHGNHAIATCTLSLLLFVFLSVFYIAASWLDLSMLADESRKEVHDFPLDCVAWNQSLRCPRNYPTTQLNVESEASLTKTCPDYFRWIHEDLRHWRDTGITRDMVDMAKGSAYFRLVIMDGKAYVESFRKSIQTRDLFTLWGFEQLLRRYPDRIPDLELMFNCDDRPIINAKHYLRRGHPPLFKYCSDPWSLDIVSPDWSFWGWGERGARIEGPFQEDMEGAWRYHLPHRPWQWLARRALEGARSF